MSKQDTKKTLLDVGMQLMLENGYNNTGLNDVLGAAGVPKGSFYYYFNSKEDFGLQLIDQFEQGNQALLHQFLDDAQHPPLTRLRRYFEFNIQYLVDLQCRQGCLVGNLGQELSDQNEVFRVRVKQVMDNWAGRLAACLKEAQEAGQLATDLDTSELGRFCLDNWQGAILMMKVTKHRQPLDTFLQSTFELLLKAPAQV